MQNKLTPHSKFIGTAQCRRSVERCVQAWLHAIYTSTPSLFYGLLPPLANLKLVTLIRGTVFSRSEDS